MENIDGGQGFTVGADYWDAIDPRARDISAR